MINFADEIGGNSKILAIGIGGAALDVVNTIADWKLKGIDTAFIDTDTDTIKSSSSPEKFHLSQRLFKKLEDLTEGSGLASQSVAKELCSFVNPLQQYEATFTVTGLGGATGTVITPYLIQILKEKSQWVWSLLTLPFFFEGKPKIINSLKGFKRINALADAVLVIPHDKIFKMVDKNISMYEAFMPANRIYTKLIGSVYRLTAPSGWVSIGLSDIKDELANKKATAFGVGEAGGARMIHKAIESAAGDSLLGKELLSGTRSLMVSILGGEDLKLKDVENGIDFLRTFIPKEGNISFGVATEKSWNGKVQVGIIALGLDSSAQDVSSSWDLSLAARKEETVLKESAPIKTRFQPISRPLGRLRTVSKPRQTTIDFKPSFKGRFDKSRPTMHEGEDLDIPTFLRRKK